MIGVMRERVRHNFTKVPLKIKLAFSCCVESGGAAKHDSVVLRSLDGVAWIGVELSQSWVAPSGLLLIRRGASAGGVGPGNAVTGRSGTAALNRCLAGRGRLGRGRGSLAD